MESLLASLVSAALSYGLAYIVHGVRDSGERSLLAKIRSIRDNADSRKLLDDLFRDTFPVRDQEEKK